MENGKIRIDKWLWHARFLKTRSLCAKFVSEGSVRVNSERVTKPAFNVAVGDHLTFMQGERVKVVEIAALGVRRGPAPEAQALYHDHSPKIEKAEEAVSSGKRPTKKDRRAIDAFIGSIKG